MSLINFLYFVGFLSIIYYLITYFIYFLIMVTGLKGVQEEIREVETRDLLEFEKGSPFLPGISIIIPAYNEEKGIVRSVEANLKVEYPRKEVMVVNDGSTDGTLEKLVDRYDLEKIDAVPPEILQKARGAVNAVYKSETYPEVVVVDKENSGRASALNTGLWLTEMELFCTVDADSIIEPDAVTEVVRPFITNPEKTLASGGTVRVLNSCEIEGIQVKSPRVSNRLLIGTQDLEYLRGFYIGRQGLDKFDILLLLAGTFSVYRSDIVRRIGGFDEDSLVEDMEIIVRLKRHMNEAERAYNVAFLGNPVVWTEVPSDWRSLAKQRKRWFLGLWDTLLENKDMMGRKRFGNTGMYGLPFYLMVEALGPVIECTGYILLPVLIFLNVIDFEFLVVYFLFLSGLGVLLSWLSLFSESLIYRKYKEPRMLVKLFIYGVIENFGVRQYKVFVKTFGLLRHWMPGGEDREKEILWDIKREGLDGNE
ncbi:MAG: glycosyltransferase [Halobacteria archaeon]